MPQEVPIAVPGMGHVGLPTALGFAEMGWKVMGADDAADKIERIKVGQATFYEPQMQDLLTKHLKSGWFRPTADVEEAIAASKLLFVFVGTPQREDGAADLSQIEAPARTIARNLNGYKVIVEKCHCGEEYGGGGHVRTHQTNDRMLCAFKCRRQSQ